MKTTRLLARSLIGALLVLSLPGCHTRVPRPGKPTAAQSQSHPLRPAPAGAAAGRPPEKSGGN